MSTTLSFKSLGDFARNFEAIGEGVVNDLLVESHKEIHLHVAEEVVGRTPVDEGEMRDNWGSVGPGQAQPTKSAEAALAGLARPGTTHVVNNAPHAIVIEKGRTKLKTGRIGGSPKAPRGVVKPTLEALPSTMRGIFSVTSRKVESKAKRRRRR